MNWKRETMKNDVYEWNEKHLNTHISECFLFYLKVKLCGLFLKLKEQIHRSQKKEVCERNGKKLIIYSIECFCFISEQEFSLIF